VPVLTGIRTLYRCLPDGGQGDVHPVPAAALAWREGRVAWVGPEADLPPGWRDEPREDAGGAIVVPGLVDCHTHLAFGGWRADEFERRILGATYLDIARAGGGIRATVARTRAASTEALVARCERHLREMVALGVTAVEAKSGYGLSVEHELRLLEVYDRLRARTPLRLVATLLGAHAVPPEFDGRSDAYADLVAEAMVPAAAARGLAAFCDVFVEEGAFTVAQARRVLRAGLAHGLRPRLHADQLSAGGGAELAAEVGAASADHLEHVGPRGIAALAAAGVVAVSLPLASLYLGQPPLPARRLIEAGVPVAVATDFNPGSAPSCHLPLALTLACTLQRMTPAEALKGATVFAARAAGLEAEAGSLAPGRPADFAVLEAESVEQWLYHFRANACLRTVVAGREAWRRPVSV
jgi:imidazolonepropionase